jgi:protein SCO1/2
VGNPLRVRLSVLTACLSAVLLLPTGCNSKNAPASGASSASAPGELKTFTIKGRIVTVDTAKSSVLLDHEAVPGFMEAMTMSYKLHDPSVISELHPGDRIMANLLVHKTADGYQDPELDQIVVTAQAKPDYKPAVQYHIPAPGDEVPDFKLLNQDNRTVHLNQFRGKIVLLTFIYTRCSVADYCPKMSRNFAEIDQDLQKEPKLYGETHLLSISFDPHFDTPKVLKSYGSAYTGESSKVRFNNWDFAVPPAAELPALTQWFGVGVTPGDGATLTHSLSTAIIGKDGKVLAWYPANEWTPAQALEVVRKAV